MNMSKRCAIPIFYFRLILRLKLYGVARDLRLRRFVQGGRSAASEAHRRQFNAVRHGAWFP